MSKRISSIEALRTLAIFAVVTIHAGPFLWRGESQKVASLRWLGYLIIFFCRFAVPYFFITAGYFFSRACAKEGAAPRVILKRYAFRFFRLMGIWSVIYALTPSSFLTTAFQYGLMGLLKRSYWHLLETGAAVREHPWTLIFYGTKLHLWFLQALIAGLLWAVLFQRERVKRWMLPLAGFLYLIAVLVTTYRPVTGWSLMGIDYPDAFYDRAGFMVSLFFVAIGWHEARRSSAAPSRTGFLMMAGILLFAVESFLFIHIWKGGEFVPSLTLGIVPLSIGIFRWALKHPQWGEGTWLEACAPCTLGIYVAHLFVLQILSPVGNFMEPVSWELARPFLLFLYSLAFVAALRKFRPLSWLVD